MNTRTRGRPVVEVRFPRSHSRFHGLWEGPDREALRQTSPEDWLLDFMRARVDCVAVTDHNTG